MTKTESALRLLADFFAGQESNAAHRELGAKLHDTLDGKNPDEAAPPAETDEDEA